MNATETPDTRGAPETPLPASVRVVSLVLMVGGALYAVIGLAGVSQESRSDALVSMALLVLGAVALGIGWSLFKSRRWAYVAAVVVLAVAVAGAVVAAIAGGDRAVLAQVFLPGLGVWLLLRRDSREHFSR